MRRRASPVGAAFCSPRPLLASGFRAVRSLRHPWLFKLAPNRHGCEVFRSLDNHAHLLDRLTSRLLDDRPDGVGHQVSRVAPRRDQFAHFRGRNLQLRDRMDVDAAGARLVQVADRPVPRSTSSSPSGPMLGARQPGRCATTSAPAPAVRATGATSAGRGTRPCRRSATANGRESRHAACASYRPNTTILRGGSRGRRP